MCCFYFKFCSMLIILNSFLLNMERIFFSFISIVLFVLISVLF